MFDTLPAPLSSLTPELSYQLKNDLNHLLLRIIKNNAGTQFARTSGTLAGFREAFKEATSDDDLLQAFRTCVQFSVYDAYLPYFSRFFQQPKEAAVKDLFAPGIPEFLTASSGTSGGKPKFFARYSPAAMAGGRIHVPVDTSISSFMWYMGYRSIDINAEDGHSVAKIKICSGTAASMRSYLGFGEEDPCMSERLPGHAAPLAVAFIGHYRTFVLMHALFAMARRDLEAMSMGFLNTFADMIHYIEDEYTVLVDAIEKGAIPNFEGMDHVRCHLESTLNRDPERAAELRAIGLPSTSLGWAGRVWPAFTKLCTIASGPAASLIPQAKWWLGPTCHIISRAFAAGECFVATPYDPMNLNQYKLTRDDIVEFLDVSKDESIKNLYAAWEVQPGKRYEVIVTTHNGLWRYRLDDIVEITGFSPLDGSPILNYIERRSAGIHLWFVWTPESVIREAIGAAQDALGKILEFTATTEETVSPARFDYFVEVAGDSEPNLQAASEQVFDTLCATNNAYQRALDTGKFQKPKIHVVKQGTFQEFRRWKAEQGSGISVGQIKVPVVFSDETTRKWVHERVIQEL
ncbi:GH3 auxin-responsive promoter [Phlebopus sp. FC_14]|nr:GH3 auxin-responsive promoter [Phlebopus sp. FC_14]